MRRKRNVNSIKWSLNCAMAALLLTSASMVGAQTLRTLYSFNSSNRHPYAGLTLGTDGNFYGTTAGSYAEGSVNSFGTVFRVATNGALTTLVAFDNSNNGPFWPLAGLTLGSDGNFYGTTSYGGGGGSGTVFKVTTNGTLTTLYSFSRGNDGGIPHASVTLGNDGNFYGTTYEGGSGGKGTMFGITADGALTTLVSFAGSTGENPLAGLTLGNDGNLYGTTPYGGNIGAGTVFRATTNGTLFTLVVFNGGSNGADPTAGLTLGNDGNFYGTTGNNGTVFKMTSNGVLTTMVVFSGPYYSRGASPNALTLGSDGNLYGTTEYGGIVNSLHPGGMGTVFRVTPNGALSTLIAFNFPVSPSDGAEPHAGLTLGSDGNLYGTTYGGGSGDYGTVFSLALPPDVTVQPQSQTCNAGTTVIFGASATSLSPMVYQWQKSGTNLVDGGNVSGTTTTNLTIMGISGNDAGSYSLIVSNASSSVTTSNAVLTVIDPPVITAQPTNLLVLAGTSAVFGVSLGGTAPFRYQWRFNGTNLISGTNAICSIPSVGTNSAGNYAVTTTNAAGSTTSSNAALTVVLSPRSRTNYAGSTATFTATAFSPQSLAYQWQKNGTNLAEGGRLSGTTNSTLTVASVSGADTANYSAVVSDAYGSVTTSNAVMTVIVPPLVTAQPANVLVLQGTNAAFGVSLSGTAPFRYQWRFNGTNLLNATNATYAISSAGTNSAGNYAVVVTNAAGSTTSSNAALTVVLSPKSRTNYASSAATFTATAFSPEPLNYQWQMNGTNLAEGGRLSGSTNSTLTIAGVSDADAANYRAVVSDASASVTTSNAVLTVNGALVIATQPQSRTVGIGSNVTFNITAYGVPPFVFQWYFKGTPLGLPTTGTNVSTCSLTNVETNQAGNYSVLVVNAYGDLVSSNAVLTVKLFPPSIGVQPASQTVRMGGDVAFSVVAGGTAPFCYQWRFNGAGIPDATNAVYALEAVGGDKAGNYSVLVTNLAGSVTSSSARLTVIAPPTLALELWAGYPLVNLSGMLGSNFVVQYSTNMVDTNWVNLLSLTNLPSSPYLFLDPAGDSEPARFYRAFMR